MTQILFGTNLTSIELSLWQAFQLLAESSTGAAGAIVLVDSKHLEAMDKALWQRPQLAFMPHALIDDPQAVNMPLIVTHSAALEPLALSDPKLLFQAQSVEYANHEKDLLAPQPRNMLINIGGEPLPVFARFSFLLEMIPSVEHPKHSGFNSMAQAIDLARKRYRHYRERGYALTHINPEQSFKQAFSDWWK